MKRIIFFLLALPLLTKATVYTWSGSISGGITISNTSTSPSLAGGDVLLMPALGNWNSISFQNLTASSNITIRFLSGSVMTTTNAGFTGSWNNVNHVRIVGMTTHNYAGNPLWFRETVHDIIFDSCCFTNDPGSFPDKNCMRWDDNTVNTMDFNGTKATTFYNVEISNCVFNGFKNTSCITLGSNGIRSVCTDFYIHHSTFKNIVNDVHLAAIGVEGTCFNGRFMYNNVDSILQPIVLTIPSNGVHVGFLTTFGYWEVAYNIFAHTYCNTIRANVLVWPSALGGAYANGHMKIHDNIDHHHRSFSSYEITNNNSTPLIEALGADTAYTDIYFNLTYSTQKDSYNGPYHGSILDLITHKVMIAHNVGVRLEWDTYPFAPDSANSKQSVISFVSGQQPGFTSYNNRTYETAAEIGLDTVNWTISAMSILRNAADMSYLFSPIDYYGRTRDATPDLGAFEYYDPTVRPSPVPRRRGRRFVHY